MRMARRKLGADVRYALTRSDRAPPFTPLCHPHLIYFTPREISGLHGNEAPCCYVVAAEAALSSPAILKRKQRPTRPPPAPLRRGFCGCKPSAIFHRSSRAADTPSHVAAIVFDLRARWCRHVLVYRHQDRACRNWVAYRSRDRSGHPFGYRGGWGGPAYYVSLILAPYASD